VFRTQLFRNAMTIRNRIAFHRAMKIIPTRPRLRFHRHAPCDRQDVPCKGVGIGIGRERAAGANLANKRGTRRVFISELLRPRAEIDIE
jgi:hypothetical protein